MYAFVFYAKETDGGNEVAISFSLISWRSINQDHSGPKPWIGAFCTPIPIGDLQVFNSRTEIDGKGSDGH